MNFTRLNLTAQQLPTITYKINMSIGTKCTSICCVYILNPIHYYLPTRCWKAAICTRVRKAVILKWDFVKSSNKQMAPNGTTQYMPHSPFAVRLIAKSSGGGSSSSATEQLVTRPSVGRKSQPLSFNESRIPQVACSTHSRRGAHVVVYENSFG
jgi:hypothetical protein